MAKPRRRSSAGTQDPSLFAAPESSRPLAARMRPRDLDEVAGQAHLLAPGKSLREAIEHGTVGSMI